MRYAIAFQPLHDELSTAQYEQSMQQAKARLCGAQSTRIVDQWSRAVPPDGERALMSVLSEERKNVWQDNSHKLAGIDGPRRR